MNASMTEATHGRTAAQGAMSTEEIKTRIEAMFTRDETKPERTSHRD